MPQHSSPHTLALRSAIAVRLVGSAAILRSVTSSQMLHPQAIRQDPTENSSESRLSRRSSAELTNLKIQQRVFPTAAHLYNFCELESQCRAVVYEKEKIREVTIQSSQPTHPRLSAPSWREARNRIIGPPVIPCTSKFWECLGNPCSGCCG